MAAITTSESRTDVPAPLGVPVKLSWGAILGAAVVVIAGYVMLMSIGVAIGLTAISPERPASAKTAGIIIGVWSVVSSLVALFVGGMVASRTAGVIDRAAGSIHGAVLWGVTTIFTLMMLASGARAIITSAAGAMQMTSQAASPVAGAIGLDSDDLLNVVNDRLQQEGKPPVTAAQMQAVTSDIARTAMREGQLDREVVVRSLTENTALSNEGARDIVQRTEGTISEKARGARTSVLRAADEAGDMMWWVFFGLLLGLGSAMAGASIGVSRRQRLAARASIPVMEPVTVRP